MTRPCYCSSALWQHCEVGENFNCKVKCGMGEAQVYVALTKLNNFCKSWCLVSSLIHMGIITVSLLRAVMII